MLSQLGITSALFYCSDFTKLMPHGQFSHPTVPSELRMLQHFQILELLMAVFLQLPFSPYDSELMEVFVNFLFLPTTPYCSFEIYVSLITFSTTQYPVNPVNDLRCLLKT